MAKRKYIRLDEEKKEQAIKAVAVYGTILEAAKAVGVNRGTIFNEMKKSAVFKEAINEARECYADDLEALLDKRIRDESNKMKDVLLMFRLKAVKPDIYRDNVQHKVDASVKIITAMPGPPDE